MLIACCFVSSNLEGVICIVFADVTAHKGFYNLMDDVRLGSGF